MQQKKKTMNEKCKRRMRRIQTNRRKKIINSRYFFFSLENVDFLHDLPLFNFESLMTDQFLHFTNLKRVQIAISFRSQRENDPIKS